MIYTTTGDVVERYEDDEVRKPPPKRVQLPSSLDEVMDQATKSASYPMWSSYENRPINVYVHIDEATKKKWVLVLRYNHKAQTNPDVKPIASGSFPIPESPNLTELRDEADTDAWGHLDASYLSKFIVKEYAYYGATSAHNRIVNFSLTAFPAELYSTFLGIYNIDRQVGAIFYRAPFLEDCKCLAPNTMFYQNGSSASLPSRASHFSRMTMDLTQSPVFIPDAAYWSVRRDGMRWEVDNVAGTEHHTLHMVFIR